MTHGVSLDVLITAALNDQPYNQLRLGREFRRYARTLSNRFAAHLPNDLHEEIAQEAFAATWARGASLLQDSTVRQALRKEVLKAVYIVQASYAPPGERTRTAPKNARVDRVAAEDVGRIASPRQVEACTIGDVHKQIDLDRMPSSAAAAAIRTMEDRIEISAILHRASPSVAEALRRHHLDDEEMWQIAAEAQISRFVLSRDVSAFSAAWRSAN